MPPPFTPAKRLLYFALTLALAATLVALLAFANRHYFFHVELYEASDFAANSLSVLRAEHFGQLYGQYSRWGFRHPGPGIFYSLALAEKVFYQWLHLVPTPFNAQVLMMLGMLSCFFAAGVSVCARWVRSAFFLPLVLLAAVLHFTAADVRTVLLGCWPPYEMVMPFFLLLAAAASVAAGEGKDLPLLALAGCVLIHLHVAQPLFVLPAFALAYAGLAWSCWRRTRPASEPLGETAPSETAPAPSALPWRVYRRGHWIVLALALAFVLPMVADLCRGAGSNLQLILAHFRAHQGETRHAWVDSLDYFLRFGVYKPALGEYSFRANAAAPAVAQLFGRSFPTTELGKFYCTHLRMTVLWLGALLFPFVALAIRGARRGAAGAPAGRWLFLGWLSAFWLLSVGLTLFWGHIQDGEMFYFNAWFNYGIYFVLAVICVAALSDLLEVAAASGSRALAWKALTALLCLLAAGARVYFTVDRCLARDGDADANRLQAHTVLAMLTEEHGVPRPKLLIFPDNDWGPATGVAALLTRHGCPVLVPAAWKNMFGDEYALDDRWTQLSVSADGPLPFDIWRIVPAAESAALAQKPPLMEGNALLVGGMELDPNAGAAIAFAGPHLNADLYTLKGWSSADPGSDFTWSVGREGLVSFRPRPVPVESAVEVTFGFTPFDGPGKGLPGHLAVHFDGVDLGTLLVEAGDATPAPRIRIPAALWNKRSPALLALGFPDAVSPQQLGQGLDTRQLGFNTKTITFQVVADAIPSPPASPNP